MTRLRVRRQMNRTSRTPSLLVSAFQVILILLASLNLISVQDRLRPVEVGKFSDHVQHMHADRDKWFELEYNVSPVDMKRTQNLRSPIVLTGIGTGGTKGVKGVRGAKGVRVPLSFWRSLMLCINTMSSELWISPSCTLPLNMAMLYAEPFLNRALLNLPMHWY